MKNQIKQIQEIHLEELIEMVKADKVMWQFINENYDCGGRQAILLQEIFCGMRAWREASADTKTESIEALREQIYRYGSLVKDRDLIARQMFLWLFEILERL